MIESREPFRGPSHRASRWAGAIAILILGSIAGVRWAGDNFYDLPRNPPVADIRAPVVVVLAGGKFRIDAALDLFASGVGRELFVVGAGPKIQLPLLLKNSDPAVVARISPDRLNHIRVENESTNTIENAQVVERYLRLNPDVHELVLVTSGYHMRRSVFVIQQFASRPIRVVPWIPENESIGRGNWWQSQLGIRITAEELLKYLFASFTIPRLKNQH